MPAQISHDGSRSWRRGTGDPNGVQKLAAIAQLTISSQIVPTRNLRGGLIIWLAITMWALVQKVTARTQLAVPSYEVPANALRRWRSGWIIS